MIGLKGTLIGPLGDLLQEIDCNSKNAKKQKKKKKKKKEKKEKRKKKR